MGKHQHQLAHHCFYQCGNSCKQLKRTAKKQFAGELLVVFFDMFKITGLHGSFFDTILTFHIKKVFLLTWPLVLQMLLYKINATCIECVALLQSNNSLDFKLFWPGGVRKSGIRLGIVLKENEAPCYYCRTHVWLIILHMHVQTVLLFVQFIC